MNIVSTRTIGNLDGVQIAMFIAHYCNNKYSYLIGLVDDAARIAAIKETVTRWLTGEKQLTTAAANGLNTRISWEDMVSPIWTCVKKAIEDHDPISGE